MGPAYLLLLLVLLVPLAAAGEDCIDYEDYLHRVSKLETPDFAVSVAVRGNHAYVADRETGLLVVDISDPLGPRIIATLPTEDRAFGVALSGTTAYVAAGFAGLLVVDISVPDTPSVIGGIDTPGFAYGVELGEDGRVFLADRDAGLHIIDGSIPGKPRVIGSVVTPNLATGIAFAGDYACVADGEAGLQIIDIRDPTAPAIVASVPTSDFLWSVAVAGHHAYLADRWLTVVDIRDPRSPVVAGQLDIPCTVVAAVGELAFVTRTSCGCSGSLTVLDLSDPVDPEVIGSVGLAGGWDVATDGEHAYVATCDGLHVVGVSNPRSPSILSRTGDRSFAGRVAAFGSWAYVAGDSGLRVVDMSDPRIPLITGMVDSVLATGIVPHGSHLFVADWWRGLRVFDVSAPGSPVAVATLPVPGNPTSVAMDGSHAFMTSTSEQGSTLDVIDVTVPGAPVTMGSLSLAPRAWDIAVAGQHAFVACDFGGLQVIDVSDPEAPVPAGQVEVEGWLSSVVVSEGMAYVVDWTGIRVIDVTDPRMPAVVGHAEMYAEPWEVRVRGSYAYVTAMSGLEVFEIANAMSPRPVGGVPVGCRTVALGGNFVCVGADGLVALPLQCQDPSPVEIFGLTAAWESECIRVSWRTPNDTRCLGFHVERAAGNDREYRRLTSELIRPPGPYVFLDLDVRPGIDYFYCLEAIDLHGARELHGPIAVLSGRSPHFALLQSCPNPFHAAHPEVTIPFELPQRSRTRLRIFDLTGRLVRTLVDETVDAGAHRATWDGRDELGREVGSAIYFYTLEAGDLSASRGLVRAR